jgi:hypothetical protein
MTAKLASERDAIKYQIRERFNRFVRGQVPNLERFSLGHDGAEGDWLTQKMGLKSNSKNEPDFLGFEMKKGSQQKTTFGDWSPDSGLYKGTTKVLERDEFLRLFGMPNPAKGNRYSWSGSVFPKVGKTNFAGQSIAIDQNGDVVIRYNYTNDSRDQRTRVKARFIKCDDLEMARWKKGSIQEKVEKKFGVLGWFRCVKDQQGSYQEIQFGLPLKYEVFSPLFRAGEIFIDCGMHQGNARPYMMWRASNRVWDKLAEY